MYGKSGKFSVKRYLQNKKLFYYRSGKTEGDLELGKKLVFDYDQFMQAATDSQIDEILAKNPKLIYALKPEILERLIEQ